MAKKLSAFGNAYNEARMKGRKTFEFRGKLYDAELDKRPQVKKARSEPSTRGRAKPDVKSPSWEGPVKYDEDSMSKGSSRPQAYDPGGGTKRGNVTTFQPTEDFRRESERTTGKFAPRPRIKVDM